MLLLLWKMSLLPAPKQAQTDANWVWYVYKRVCIKILANVATGFYVITIVTVLVLLLVELLSSSRERAETTGSREQRATNNPSLSAGPSLIYI